MNLNIENKIMKQYIDKDILVTEIEKRLKHNDTRAELDRSSYMTGRENEDKDILTLLDTLEVKKMELDSEITLWANAIPEIRLDDIERLATYFFELGLKTKGE